MLGRLVESPNGTPKGFAGPQCSRGSRKCLPGRGGAGDTLGFRSELSYYHAINCCSNPFGGTQPTLTSVVSHVRMPTYHRASTELPQTFHRLFTEFL